MDQTTLLTATGQLRFDTFEKTIRLAKNRQLQNIIETGTMRTHVNCQDGSSTLVFSWLADDINGQFISVDINKVNQDLTADFLKQRGTGTRTTLVNLDSVEFLSKYAGRIDLLYLDSYDYVQSDYMPCQLHQLAELGGAYGKLTDNALILIDDCALPFGGKAGLSSAFLKCRGWKLLQAEYQQLWSR
jgi:predicted O-methyltransferase YrrM